METWEATKLTLCQSSRSRVEAARRATSLGLVGQSAPKKVDSLARQLADAEERLQRDQAWALKALEQVRGAKAAITQLQQELAEAKNEAAALYGGGHQPRSYQAEAAYIA